MRCKPVIISSGGFAANSIWFRNISNWLGGEERDTGTELCTVESMKTRFDELKLRLGAHYMYRHVGGCEHVVVFHEMRCLPFLFHRHQLPISWCA